MKKKLQPPASSVVALFPTGYPYDDYYKEYQNLGGKKNRKTYDKNLRIFLDQTLEIFVWGNPVKHDNRQKALKATKKEAKITYEELNLIFDSVDNVSAYT